MCYGTEYIMLGLAIASAAVGTYSSVQQQKASKESARRQAEYANAALKAQAEARVEDASEQMRQLQLQQQQINQAASQEMSERAIAARQARARAVVAAGEAGIGGITPHLIEQNILGEAYRDISVIESNRSKQIQQTEYEKYAAYRRGKTVGPPPAFEMPGVDYLGPFARAGLQIGSAYTDYKIRTEAAGLGKTDIKTYQV